MTGGGGLHLTHHAHRIDVADNSYRVWSSLADLEGGIAEHWQPDYHSEPATLADFECAHLRIGPCPDCDPAVPIAAVQVRAGR